MTRNAIIFRLLVLSVAGLVASSNAQTNAALKELGNGAFELGAIRLDKRQRTITFPAQVNMSAGVIEYLLVNAKGKVHESVLRTVIEPTQLHIAKLLISTNAPASAASTNSLAGEPMSISVTWLSGEIQRTARADELIWNSQSASVMARGNWIYNGARVLNGTFTAQRDGSIIALIDDPDALVNNPRPGRENDEIWQVNTNAVPSLNTPVEVTIQFLK